MKGKKLIMVETPVVEEWENNGAEIIKATKKQIDNYLTIIVEFKDHEGRKVCTAMFPDDKGQSKYVDHRKFEDLYQSPQ